MVDKKVELKPKAKAPKVQKTVTSKKKSVKNEVEKPQVVTNSEVETETLVSNSKSLVTAEPEAQLAKAGKHSAKALAEAEVKKARQDRAKSGEPDHATPKQTKNPPRSRAQRAGKKYREALKLYDKNKTYSLSEALEIAVKTSITKFDATVELHVNLAVDPKIADQNIRDNLRLPAGTGKDIRVAAFCEADDVAKAKAAGAQIVGADQLSGLLDKQQIDFDVLVASTNLMPRLGKYARLLGPRGLMPSAKSGTLTTDVVHAVSEAKAGRVEYRVDQAGIVHLGIGKVSFGADKLLQNANAVMTSIRQAKPAAIKASYIRSISISTTMGPGIRVNTAVQS